MSVHKWIGQLTVVWFWFNRLNIICTVTWLRVLRLFIRPHRSNVYVDAAYCYLPRLPSSVVCRSVSLSVTLVSPAKTAEPIEMQFAFRTRVGSGNHALDGSRSPIWEGQFWGRKERPMVKYRDALRSSVQNGWTDRDAVWVMGSNGPKKSCVRWESTGAEVRCHGNQFWD